MITLLDYGAGNVRSVINAIESLGEKVKTAKSGEEIVCAEKLVFPGVGSFGSMMSQLHEKGFIRPLLSYLESGRPFLGICLGLQALFGGSEEAPGIKGLGILKGTVKRFDVRLPVPHMGWNGIFPKQPSYLFRGLKGNEKFYFVHSFHVVAEDPASILTITDYGYPFVSAVFKENIVATQFHPEKSGQAGLKMLENFIRGGDAGIMPEIAKEPTRLARRIIACLDVRANDAGDLVVTKGDQYDVREKGEVRNMGKPVSLARRYYEEGADEIIFLNITGFRDFPLEDMPMLVVLEKTSEHVFVPLTIGGGIRDYTDSQGRSYTALEVATRYFRSGADKVSIGSEAVEIAISHLLGRPTKKNPISEISKIYGSQAVVISIDPKRVYVKSPGDTKHRVIKTDIKGPGGEEYCWYQCTVKGGREGRDIDAITLALICEALGAGEILLNCIDRDGTNIGYDIELIRAVKEAVQIPVIASSGAGHPSHFLDAFRLASADAALAAGIFHRNEVSIPRVKSFLKANGIDIRYTGFFHLNKMNIGFSL